MCVRCVCGPFWGGGWGFKHISQGCLGSEQAFRCLCPPRDPLLVPWTLGCPANRQMSKRGEKDVLGRSPRESPGARVELQLWGPSVEQVPSSVRASVFQSVEWGDQTCLMGIVTQFKEMSTSFSPQRPCPPVCGDRHNPARVLRRTWLYKYGINQSVSKRCLLCLILMQACITSDTARPGVPSCGKPALSSLPGLDPHWFPLAWCCGHRSPQYIVSPLGAVTGRDPTVCHAEHWPSI